MNEIHVIPAEDLIEHEALETCVCLPSPRLIETPDGEDGWIYSHFALCFENDLHEPKMR
jgi:hypothetical protein